MSPRGAAPRDLWSPSPGISSTLSTPPTWFYEAFSTTMEHENPRVHITHGWIIIQPATDDLYLALLACSFIWKLKIQALALDISATISTINMHYSP